MYIIFKILQTLRSFEIFQTFHLFGKFIFPHNKNNHQLKTMNQFPDGLNFVPMLGRNSSPPASSRSRLSLTPKISQRSLVYYNGNYEGDITMFKERSTLMQLEPFTLVETDSETEFKKDMELYKEPAERNTMKENQLWQLMKHYLLHFLTPEVVMKITQLTESLIQSRFYSCLKVCGKYFKIGFLWFVRLLMLICSKLGIMSSGLWRCRTCVRNITRRLLWWLTLAKCGDLTLFTLVLLCTPWLFLVAVMGFVLSLYCSIKDYVKRSGGFLGMRIF